MLGSIKPTFPIADYTVCQETGDLQMRMKKKKPTRAARCEENEINFLIVGLITGSIHLMSTPVGKHKQQISTYA